MSHRNEASKQALPLGTYHSSLVTMLGTLATGTPANVQTGDIVASQVLATLAGVTFVPPGERDKVTDAFDALRKRIVNAEKAANGKHTIYLNAIGAIDEAVAQIEDQPEKMPPAGNGQADPVIAASETGKSSETRTGQ